MGNSRSLPQSRHHPSSSDSVKFYDGEEAEKKCYHQIGNNNHNLHRVPYQSLSVFVGGVWEGTAIATVATAAAAAVYI